MYRLADMKCKYDVLVVGGGGAGLMAAVEAAEKGASVLLVEGQSELGGSTAMAVGTLSAAGTDLQKAAGIEDSTDAHFRDYLGFIGEDHTIDDYDVELTRMLVDFAPSVVARMKGLGVEFNGPQPEPPHTVYRMHNAVPDATAYTDALLRAAGRVDVEMWTRVIVSSLGMDRNGVVSQATLKDLDEDETRVVEIERGVVLATGYFSANREMGMAHGRPEEHDDVEPLFQGATGDGISLAVALGAATAGMRADDPPHFRTVDRPWVHPPAELFEAGAILVNLKGERYVNELVGPELATSRQQGKVGFLVFDARLAAQVATADQDTLPSRDGWYQEGRLFLSTFPEIGYGYVKDYLQRTDYFSDAGTVEGLAKFMKVSATSLGYTIRQVNHAAAGCSVDSFGRNLEGFGLGNSPLYALGPIKAVLGSRGGLKVDRDMHVLDQSGQLIPHLYAAGMCGSSNTLLAGHGHALAWAFGTGRISGVNAAAVGS